MNAPKLLRKSIEEGMIRLEKFIHWKTCGANGIHVKPKWYRHQPEVVIDLCKTVLNFSVQTVHFITARRSDMVVIDKEHNEC